MYKKLPLLISLTAILFLMTGCVQKTKVSMKVPGELNVKGVHKIAIIDFSSVESNSELGLYAAKSDILTLAKDELISVFYNEPFYAFSNLEIEKNIKKNNLTANIKERFDGLLYGKMWWQVTPEYKNIIPTKVKLETYRIAKYVCGRDKKGNPTYCNAHITLNTQEKSYQMPYRVKNATLMMSLNLYKVAKDGRLSKITEVFEIAKGKFEIKNGEYGDIITLIGEEEKLDKIKVLDKKGNFFDNLFAKKAIKVDTDKAVVSEVSTIPSDYYLSKVVIEKISKRLQEMIAPTTKDFELKVEKGDKKIEKLFDYSAFNSITEYIVENILAQKYKQFYEGFYDADFIDNTKTLLAFIDKEEFELKNKDKEVADVYEAMEESELTELANSYLKSNAPMLYNYALATEALGNFEKSLEIYRFLFHTIDDKDQTYADGIGRSLLALDMGDKVNEETINAIKAKKRNSLN